MKRLRYFFTFILMLFTTSQAFSENGDYTWGVIYQLDTTVVTKQGHVLGTSTGTYWVEDSFGYREVSFISYYPLNQPVEGVLLLPGRTRPIEIFEGHQTLLAIDGYRALTIRYTADTNNVAMINEMDAGLDLLRNSPNILPNKIAVLGTSYGGGLAINYLSLRGHKNRVAVGAIIYPFLYPQGVNPQKYSLIPQIPLLHLLGEQDAYFNHSQKLQQDLETWNPTLNTCYGLYTQEDFPLAGHGYFAPADISQISPAGIDSLTRILQTYETTLRQFRNPDWWTDDEILRITRDNQFGLDDLFGELPPDQNITSLDEVTF